MVQFIDEEIHDAERPPDDRRKFKLMRGFDWGKYPIVFLVVRDPYSVLRYGDSRVPCLSQMPHVIVDGRSSGQEMGTFNGR